LLIQSFVEQWQQETMVLGDMSKQRLFQFPDLSSEPLRQVSELH
jgi:hypothetical protein